MLRLELAIRLLRRMQELGLKPDVYSPPLSPYWAEHARRALSLSVELMQFDDGPETLWNFMDINKVRRIEVLLNGSKCKGYNAVLAACQDAGDWQMGLAIFEETQWFCHANWK